MSDESDSSVQDTKDKKIKDESNSEKGSSPKEEKKGKKKINEDEKNNILGDVLIQKGVLGKPEWIRHNVALRNDGIELIKPEGNHKVHSYALSALISCNVEDVMDGSLITIEKTDGTTIQIKSDDDDVKQFVDIVQKALDHLKKGGSSKTSGGKGPGKTKTSGGRKYQPFIFEPEGESFFLTKKGVFGKPEWIAYKLLLTKSAITLQRSGHHKVKTFELRSFESCELQEVIDGKVLVIQRKNEEIPLSLKFSNADDAEFIMNHINVQKKKPRIVTKLKKQKNEDGVKENKKG